MKIINFHVEKTRIVLKILLTQRFKWYYCGVPRSKWYKGPFEFCRHSPLKDILKGNRKYYEKAMLSFFYFL